MPWHEVSWFSGNECLFRITCSFVAGIEDLIYWDTFWCFQGVDHKSEFFVLCGTYSSRRNIISTSMKNVFNTDSDKSLFFLSHTDRIGMSTNLTNFAYLHKSLWVCVYMCAFERVCAWTLPYASINSCPDVLPQDVMGLVMWRATTLRTVLCLVALVLPSSARC